MKMSQDQVWWLLLGISLVKKLVNNWPYTVYGDTFNPSQIVKDMTYRIIKHMHVTEYKKITPRTTIAIRKWRIKNPVTKELVKRWPMGWSDVMAWFALGFARAGKWITDQNLDWHNNIDPEREISKLIFAHMKNGNLNKVQELLIKAGMPPIKEYSVFGGRLLGTIANFRGSDIVNLVAGTYDFMGPLQYVLHNDASTYEKLKNKMTFFQNQLNSAPQEWPYNFGGTDRPDAYDWTSQNLLWDPEDRGTIDPNDANRIWQKVGEYNGLDYMVLHNLFLLTYKNQIENFIFSQ
jgi:hypothetical protein